MEREAYTRFKLDALRIAAQYGSAYTIPKEPKMATPESLNSELKRWVLHHNLDSINGPRWHQASSDKDNSAIHLKDFIAKYAPSSLKYIYPGVFMDQKPDESPEAYNIRATLEQARADALRAEKREDRAKVIRSAVLFAFLAIASAWGTGFLALFGLTTLCVSGALTGIAFLIASILLFINIPERPKSE